MKRLALLPALALVIACGDSPTEPAVPEPEAVNAELLVVAANEASTQGISHRCFGQLVSEIASTWPWARDHETFPPPPGSIALWIETYLPEGSTVRSLQQMFCD